MTDRHDLLDELLERTLRAEAEAQHPTPDWEDVRQRADAGRRRWPVLVAAAILALLAAAVMLQPGSTDEGVVADGSEDPTSTTTTPTTSPSDRDPDPVFSDGPTYEPLDLPTGAPLDPDEIVAVVEVPSSDEFARVAVVVLSRDTGEAVRTLADGFDTVEGGAYGLTLTPDRTAVAYTVGTSACSALIEVVAADGSSEPVELFADGGAIAFSPDGEMFAVARGDDCVAPADVDIAPISGGRSVRYAADDGRVATTALAFGDSVRLFAAGWGDDGEVLQAVDVAARSAVSWAPESGGGATFTQLDSTSVGVTAVAVCCGSDHGDVATLLRLSGTDGERPVIIDPEHGLPFATFDRNGDLITIVGRTLSIGDRVLRDGVVDVTL